MKHLRYLRYVLRHKWYVFRAGLLTKAPLWRLIIHDWSKFSKAEWNPYVNFFYGKGVDYEFRTPEVKSAFSRAFHHHIHRNAHHWEYWLRYRASDGSFAPLEMPEKLVREMVADWAGAGRAITGEWELASWYEANAHKIKLHGATRKRVYALVEQTSKALDIR
jgi:hypothetical protein